MNTVAETLGVSSREVLEMESRLSGRDIGFDGSPDNDDDDAAYVAPASFIEDSRFEPAIQTERDEWETHNKERLYHALKGLDERSQDIISSRWLGDKKKTLQELADIYSVSAERIRQLEKNALNKLKNVLVV